MSIKTISGFRSTLQNSDMKNWTNKAEIGSFKEYSPLKQNRAEDGNGIEKTFGDFLKDSVNKVNELQNEANVAMEKLASGQSQNLHETLLAVEKADIAFKTMNQVRSKVIDAYKEIMKMQI